MNPSELFRTAFSKDAFLLAGLTAIAYFCAFIFEYAYAGHFGISIRLETISTQTILSAFAVMLVGFLSWGPLANELVNLLKHSNARYFLLGFSYIGPVLLGLFIAYLTGGSVWIWGVLTIAVILVTYSFVVVPFLKKQHQHGYGAVLKEQLEKIHSGNTWPTRLRTFFGHEQFEFIFALIFILPFLSFLAGSWIALGQSDFTMTSRNGDWLMVAASQEQMLFAGFDASTNKLNGKVLALKGKELEAVVLQNIKLLEPPKHW